MNAPYDIHIRGFLSYSGGDESYRDNLESTLIQKASDFSKSISFEREFLDRESLSQRLLEADVALFSCFRDEGVTFLRQFVSLGGLVCFNKFSINFSFFNSYCPNKTLSHEDLFSINLENILEKKRQKPEIKYNFLNYSEITDLSLFRI